VGLLHALHAHQGRYASAARLAEEACAIEIERCGEPIGKQDQYAAAFGGLNFIQFRPDDTVSVDPIICRRETRQRLAERLLIFYTGISRRSARVLEQQQASMATRKETQAMVGRMMSLAYDLRAELQKDNLEALGEIIHANWELKRRLTPNISSTQINRWYDIARRHGAVGGKLLGAGSGGFLMFCAPRERHEAIALALKELRRVHLNLEPEGSKIVFVHD